VFLYSQGWRYMEVAGFVASWTISYGLVQAIAPSVTRRGPDGLSIGHSFFYRRVRL
jgi:hypothetical protein